MQKKTIKCEFKEEQLSIRTFPRQAGYVQDLRAVVQGHGHFHQVEKKGGVIYFQVSLCRCKVLN